MRHTVKTTADIQKENGARIAELQKQFPECKGEPIIHFDGHYGFLSNFYHSPIELEGHSFLNGEAAFQGFKDLTRIGEFKTIQPSRAKSLGRQVKLRSDWEQVKTSVMEEVVMAKFSQNLDLQKKLLATGDRLLVEGNWWRDDTWGVSNGRGENRLGLILMKVRSHLRDKKGAVLFI